MPETQPETQKEIATINGRHFYKDSMSEELVAAFNQALEINEKIFIKENDIRDLKYARQFIINFINSKADEMTEYFPPESQEPQESQEDKTDESNGE